MLLNFSFTGEASTGQATFTTTKEYKFKNLYLKDIKYTITGEDLYEEIAVGTAGDGQAGISIQATTIPSPLALHMDFLDNKDCMLYGLKDGADTGGESVGDPQNIIGMIPIGCADVTLQRAYYQTLKNNVSHSYPYKLINNRPQTWESGKTLTFTLYYRDVRTDGLVKDWALMSSLTDAFNDMCSIDITLELE